jgi:hypothetical protein
LVVNGDVIHDFFSEDGSSIIGNSFFSYGFDNFSVFIFERDFSCRFDMSIPYVFYRKGKINVEIFLILTSVAGKLLFSVIIIFCIFSFVFW